MKRLFVIWAVCFLVPSGLFAGQAIMLTEQDLKDLNLLQEGTTVAPSETLGNPTDSTESIPLSPNNGATSTPSNPSQSKPKSSDWKLSLWQKPFYADQIADPYAPTTQFSLYFVTRREVDDSNRVELRPGYSIAFARLHPEENPNLGLELFFYLSFPLRMTADRFRMISLDGIFGLGLGISPTNWLDLRLYRHHFSAHAGDELKDIDQSKIDYDTSMKLLNAMYVRDEWGFSIALEPFGFFSDPPKGWYARAYGEAFLATAGEDLFGPMYVVPSIDSPWWFQWGLEGSYSFENPKYGGLFAAINVSYFQENGYTPNTSIMAGYQFPYTNSIGTSIAFTWYKGRARDTTFYHFYEEMFGLTLKLSM